MKKLVDTSILHAAIIVGHEAYRACRSYMTQIHRGDFSGIVVANSLLELFASLTNPRCISPVLTTHEAFQCCEQYRNFPNLDIVTPLAEDYLDALKLAEALNLSRSKIFDGLLIVTARRVGVTAAITLNSRDFEKFAIMTVESP